MRPKSHSQINIWDVDIKDQVFVEIMVEYYGKHGQGIHCTQMGADSSAENTPNAPEFMSPICLPKPKSSGFQEKRLHWASVVRGAGHKNKNEFAAG